MYTWCRKKTRPLFLYNRCGRCGWAVYARGTLVLMKGLLPAAHQEG